jgi:hypothetical protein
MSVPSEKPGAQYSEKHEGDVAPSTPTLSEHDDENDVPPGYWTSPRFIGSLIAIVLLANAAFIQYSLPVSWYNAFLECFQWLIHDLGQSTCCHQC